jgi:hypothetical protein
MGICRHPSNPLVRIPWPIFGKGPHFAIWKKIDAIVDHSFQLTKKIVSAPKQIKLSTYANRRDLVKVLDGLLYIHDFPLAHRVVSKLEIFRGYDNERVKAVIKYAYSIRELELHNSPKITSLFPFRPYNIRSIKLANMDGINDDELIITHMAAKVHLIECHSLTSKCLKYLEAASDILIDKCINIDIDHPLPNAKKVSLSGLPMVTDQSILNIRWAKEATFEALSITGGALIALDGPDKVTIRQCNKIRPKDLALLADSIASISYEK